MARGGNRSFKGKIKPGDSRRAQQAKRSNAKGGPKGPRGGFASFLGAVGAVAAVCIGVLVQQTQRQKQKSASDSLLLGRMRRLPLIITEHADCRMDCRHISRGEVDEVLKSGRINGRKSAPALRPCPKYVIDGQVGADGKNVECVVSACPQATHLVTVIDQDTDWSAGCYCP